MDRRQFLYGSLGATLAGPLLADMMAQAQAPAPAAAAPAAARPPVAAGRKLILDANSKHLQWIRTADGVAEAAIEMVVGGVAPTVRAYPGHIDPSKVATELPAFVKTIRGHGLKVTQIMGPDVSDATAPNVEAIVGTAAQNGITHYSLGGYTYDLSKPLQPQLDAIKVKVDKLVALSRKHNVKLLFDTGSTPTAVGANVLDLLGILKSFDSKYVGLRWDTGNMALHGEGMWETLLRLSGAYVGAIGWRDRGWKQDLGLLGEGGPYPGPIPRVNPLVTLPDGSAIPGPLPANLAGSVPPPAAGAGRAGGRGARGGGEGEEGAAPAAAAAAAAPAAGGRAGGGAPAAGGRGGGAAAPAAGGRGGGAPAAPAAGRGAPRGPANSAGAGSIDDSNPLYDSRDGEMPKRPIGGKNAKGAGWSAPDTSMGTGVLHIPRFATVIAEMGFNGPSILQAEFSGMGGAEKGADKIDRPRQWVIGMLKREVITVRKSFEMADALSKTGVSI